MPAAAEGTEALLALSAPEQVLSGEEINIDLDALVGGLITDGKLVITYDSELAGFAGAAEQESWAALTSPVLSGTPGRLILAFTGDRAAEKGGLIKLRFTALAAGSALFALDADASYINSSEDYMLGGEVTRCLWIP